MRECGSTKTASIAFPAASGVGLDNMRQSIRRRAAKRDMIERLGAPLTQKRALVASRRLVFIVASCLPACSNSGSELSVGAGGSGAPPSGALGPELATLAISLSGTSTPLALVPEFSPDIHDYYVRCAAGANALTVSLVASAGAQSLLLQPSPSGSVAQQTIALSVTENQAVVAAATNGAATAEYWVRCLPHDFPTMQMVANPAVGTPSPGYYLVGNEQAPADGPAYAMVLDRNGVPVWYYSQPQTGSFGKNTGVFDVDCVVGGTVSFIPWPSSSARFEIHQFLPFKTTTLSATAWAVNPHELRPLANGDYLVFTNEIQEGLDLTGYSAPLPDGKAKSYGPNSSILPCDILEVDPAGDVVWKWLGTDHFDPVKDNTFRRLELAPNGKIEPDPFHCNSIDLDPRNGNLLVSSRNMDSIFYIDRASGAVLWKMGGASYTKDGAVEIPMGDAFHRQHDARFQPGWSDDCGGMGQISLFDDETAEDQPARAVIYDITVGSPSGGTTSCPAAGATVAWQHAGARNTEFMGSFRVLNDGSRIIGWGFGGERSLVFTEVDAAGNELLKFYFTDDSWSYRSIKVPLDALDLEVMRRVTGLQ
jgi:hypothetical protein